MPLSANSSLCSGCRTCLVACAVENFREINPAKAALGVEGKFPAPGVYEVQVCDQCGSCAEVCPVDAIEEQDGAYLIDTEECTGCGLCVEECPKDVMYLHKDSQVPIKCTLCGACVEICPRGVLSLDGEEVGRAAK